MIKTLRESKARLSELVDRAAKGEEVIITVRGRPKARLAAIAREPLRDMAAWARRLRKLQRACATGRKTADGATIVSDLREERA